MTELDKIYTEYNYIKTVKEKKNLSIDWSSNNEWKTIVKKLCENLSFKWSMSNTTKIIYFYFYLKPSDEFTDLENDFIKNYYNETIVLKIYSDGQSYLGNILSNIKEPQALITFVNNTDAYRLPDFLVEVFTKLKELITSPQRPKVLNTLMKNVSDDL